MHSQRTHFLSFRLAALLCGALCAFVHTANALTIDSVAIVEPASGNAVPRYSKIEFLVSLNGSVATKYYEPDPARSGLDLSATFLGPGSSKINIKGFFDGSVWRIRFAPGIVGRWRFNVSAADGSGSAKWNGGTFTCVPSDFPGFATVNGKYLKFNNGQTFFAIGHNNGWQYDVEQPSFVDMAAEGENLMSFWMASPWIEPADNIPRTPIENAAEGIGNYNQNSCAFIDGIVSRAEQAGVYLLPSIWAHDQLCDGTPAGWPASWNNNAYKTLCAAKDFYTTTSGGTDTPQWRYQQNFYRYLLARWGYSRAIAGFVAVVEIDGTDGFALNPGQINTWSVKVQDYFIANDKFRVSRSKYPISLSRVDQPTYDTGFHMRSGDCYVSNKDNLAVAQSVATQIMTMRSSNKPSFHAEFGGDVTAGATQPAHLHNGVWAGLASGSAMTPLLWCDGGNYPRLTDSSRGTAMRAQLKNLAQFVNEISYVGDASLIPANPKYSSNSLRGWGMRLGRKAFVWTQHKQGSNIGGETLLLPNLLPGLYTVAWFDTWTSGSEPFATSTVRNTDVLTVTIPTLARGDVACSIYPAK